MISEGRRPERNPMAAGKRQQLGSDARAVLALLPPTGYAKDFAGAYLGDISQDLLGHEDSIARARIRVLLHEIDAKIGYLRRHHARGPVPYGQRVSYSVPPATWPEAERALKRGYAVELKP